MQYTIYVIPTNKCNLTCKHCYHSIVDDTTTIDQSVLTGDVVEWIKRFRSTHDDVAVIIHGGEPGLYPPSTLCEFADKIHHAQCRLMITTNLVYRITDDHIKLFDMIDDHVIQTSWDYQIRFANDRQLLLWESNVAMLVDHGLIVQPTVTVTRQLVNDIDPVDLMRYLMLNRCRRINFERLTNTGRAAGGIYRPSNIDCDRWLTEAYKVYKSTDWFDDIPLFSAIEDSIFNNELIGCRARKCTETVYTINPDLSIGSCPNTCNLTFANVNNNTIDNNKRIIVINEERKQSTECLSCDIYRYCNRDCFQLERSSLQANDNSSCHGLKNLYHYIIDQHRADKLS